MTKNEISLSFVFLSFYSLTSFCELRLGKRGEKWMQTLSVVDPSLPFSFIFAFSFSLLFRRCTEPWLRRRLTASALFSLLFLFFYYSCSPSFYRFQLLFLFAFSVVIFFISFLLFLACAWQATLLSQNASMWQCFSSSILFSRSSTLSSSSQKRFSRKQFHVVLFVCVCAHTRFNLATTNDKQEKVRQLIAEQNGKVK